MRIAVVSSFKNCHHECYGMWMAFAYARGYKVDMYVPLDSPCEGWLRFMDMGCSAFPETLHRWLSVKEFSPANSIHYDIIAVVSEPDPILKQLARTNNLQRTIVFQHGNDPAFPHIQALRLHSRVKPDVPVERTAFLTQLQAVPSAARKMRLLERARRDRTVRVLLIGSAHTDLDALARLRAPAGVGLHITLAGRSGLRAIRDSCPPGARYDEQLRLPSSRLMALASECDYMLVAKTGDSIYARGNVSGMYPAALATLCRIVHPEGTTAVAGLASAVCYEPRGRGPILLPPLDTGAAEAVLRDARGIRESAFRALDGAVSALSPPLPVVRDLPEGSTDRGDPRAIPRTIHMMWMDRLAWDSGVPHKYLPNFRAWQELHPGWEVRFWNTPRFLQLLEQDGADPGMRRWFSELTVHYARCDFARLYVVHRFGGLYLDMDFAPLKPVDELLRDKSTFVVPELSEHLLEGRTKQQQITNGYFAFARGHPYLQHLMQHIVRTVPTDGSKYSPMKTTGPYAWGDCLQTYREAGHKLQTETTESLVLGYNGTGNVTRDIDGRHALFSYTLWIDGGHEGHKQVSSVQEPVQLFLRQSRASVGAKIPRDTHSYLEMEAGRLEDDPWTIAGGDQRRAYVAGLCVLGVSAAVLLAVVVWLAVERGRRAGAAPVKIKTIV